MLMGKENEYCGNGYVTESDLQIQWNPDQNSILHVNMKNNDKIPKYKWPWVVKAILSTASNPEGITRPLASGSTSESS